MEGPAITAASVTLTYRQLQQTIRPARVAVQVAAEDPHWMQSVGLLIERLSMTWGGSTALVVPVDAAGEVSDGLWRLVELYDADLWGVYLPSWRALQRLDPTEFDRRIAEQAEEHVQAHGGDLGEIERQLRDQVLRDGPWTAGGVHKTTEERLRDRTGISTGIDGHIDCEYFFAGGEESSTQHVTRVLDLDPLPAVVHTLDLSKLPPTVSAMVHARTGHLSDADAALLTRRGVSVEPIVVDPADLGALLAHTWGARDRARRSITDAATGTEFGLSDLFGRLPYRFAELGCASLTRLWFGAHSYPQVVVVGDTIHDFADAHAMERCAGTTVWLPMSVIDDPELGPGVLEQLAWWLWSGAGARRGERPRFIVSCSLTADELDLVVARIRERAHAWMVLDDIHTGLPDLPPFRVPQLFDAHHYGTPRDEPFEGASMARGVPAQTPSSVTAADPSALRWWVDVNDGRHQLPARTALHRSVVLSDSSYPFEIVRSGRDAVSFASHTMGFTVAGARLEDVIVRPRLRFPDAGEIFEELLRDAGVSVQLSDKGQYQLRCLELWGGLDALAADLASPVSRPLLDGWLLGKDDTGSPGTHDGTRRFLSFADCEQLSGADQHDVRAVLTRYLQNGILRRGYMLRCKRCSNLGWYALEQVAATFQCRRCWSVAVPDVDRVPDSGEDLRVTYELNEVVYQFLIHNGAAPVAALQRLRGGRSSFLLSPELKLTKEERDCELDILAIADGLIHVGEVKTCDRLASTAKAEAEAISKVLAAAVDATADAVVFATTQQWRPSTTKLIETRVGSSPFQLVSFEQL